MPVQRVFLLPPVYAANPTTSTTGKTTEPYRQVAVGRFQPFTLRTMNDVRVGQILRFHQRWMRTTGTPFDIRIAQDESNRGLVTGFAHPLHDAQAANSDIEKRLNSFAHALEDALCSNVRVEFGVDENGDRETRHPGIFVTVTKTRGVTGHEHTMEKLREFALHWQSDPSLARIRAFVSFYDLSFASIQGSSFKVEHATEMQMHFIQLRNYESIVAFGSGLASTFGASTFLYQVGPRIELWQRT